MKKNYDIDHALPMLIEHILSVTCIIYNPHSKPALRN